MGEREGFTEYLSPQTFLANAPASALPHVHAVISLTSHANLR
jgi:hypothetical protein